MINTNIQYTKTKAVHVPTVEIHSHKNANLQQLLNTCKTIQNESEKRTLQEIIIFCTICGNSQDFNHEYYFKIQQDLQQINLNFTINDAKTLIMIANSHDCNEPSGNNFSKQILYFLTQLSIAPDHEKLNKINFIMVKGLNSKLRYTKEKIKYFSEMVYLKAKFNGNRFEKIILNGYDFSDKDFSDFVFKKTTLTNIDFTNSTFIDTTFYHSTLEYVNFSCANLVKTNFFAIKFTKTYMINTNLENLSLFNCKFQTSQIIDSNFYDVEIEECNFNDTIFELSKYSLKVDDHQNKNQLIGSLATIKNEVLKNNLIQQVINHIILSANSKKWVTESKAELEFFMIYLEGMPANSLKEFMIKNNNFFNQLIHQVRSVNHDMAERANKLYKIFLSLAQFELVLKKYAYDSRESVEDSLEYHSINSLFFINIDTVLMVNAKYMNQCLYDQKASEGIIRWYEMLYYNGKELINTNYLNLATLFDMYSLFEFSYKTKNVHRKLFNFLEKLNLGAYLQLFKEKTDQKMTLGSENLCNFTDKLALGEIFSKFFSNGETHKDLTIVDEHLAMIFKQFEMKNYNIFDRAKLLIVLSAIMAYYSSENVFGNSNDAPEALRFYAYGLVKAAYNMYPNIFMLVPLKNFFIALENRFLGLNGAESCTHEIAVSLWNFCHINFPTLANEIIPQAWEKM